MSGTDFYQSVIIAHWVNNEKNRSVTHACARPCIWYSIATR